MVLTITKVTVEDINYSNIRKMTSKMLTQLLQSPHLTQPFRRMIADELDHRAMSKAQNIVDREQVKKA